MSWTSAQQVTLEPLPFRMHLSWNTQFVKGCYSHPLWIAEIKFSAPGAVNERLGRWNSPTKPARTGPAAVSCPLCVLGCLTRSSGHPLKVDIFFESYKGRIENPEVWKDRAFLWRSWSLVGGREGTGPGSDCLEKKTPDQEKPREHTQMWDSQPRGYRHSKCLANAQGVEPCVLI